MPRRKLTFAQARHKMAGKVRALCNELGVRCEVELDSPPDDGPSFTSVFTEHVSGLEVDVYLSDGGLRWGVYSLQWKLRSRERRLTESFGYADGFHPQELWVLVKSSDALLAELRRGYLAAIDGSAFELVSPAAAAPAAAAAPEPAAAAKPAAPKSRIRKPRPKITPADRNLKMAEEIRVLCDELGVRCEVNLDGDAHTRVFIEHASGLEFNMSFGDRDRRCGRHQLQWHLRSRELRLTDSFGYAPYYRHNLFLIVKGLDAVLAELRRGYLAANDGSAFELMPAEAAEPAAPLP